MERQSVHIWLNVLACGDSTKVAYTPIICQASQSIQGLFDKVSLWVVGLVGRDFSNVFYWPHVISNINSRKCILSLAVKTFSKQKKNSFHCGVTVSLCCVHEHSVFKQLWCCWTNSKAWSLTRRDHCFLGNPLWLCSSPCFFSSCSFLTSWPPFCSKSPLS